MFQILIIPSDSSANAALFFRTSAVAKAAWQNIRDRKNAGEEIIQEDDFGVILSILPHKISYVLFGDIVKQQELLALQGKK